MNIPKQKDMAEKRTYGTLNTKPITNMICKRCGNKSGIDPCPTCGKRNNKNLMEFDKNET